MIDDPEIQALLAQMTPSQRRIADEVIDCALIISSKYGSTDTAVKKFRRIGNALVDDYLDNLPEVITQTDYPSEPEYRDGDCVYIIGLRGQPQMFKIGQSNSIAKRLDAISTSNPNQPYLVHAFYISDKNWLETQLHRQFAGKRAHREWFELNDADLIDVIEMGNDLLDIARASDTRA